MLSLMTESATPQPDALDPEAEGLKLPAGIELLEKVGTGRTCTVYKVHFQGETLALKAYKSDAVDWYRKKIDKNIAIFEMMQNRTLRAQPALTAYTAKPIRVIGQDGKASLCFLQEFVDGISIKDLGRRYGSIPEYLMRTAEVIARTSEEHSLKGIDDFMASAKLRRSASTWMPVMFDFKHIPGSSPAPPQRSFLQRIGLSKQPTGPGGFLGNWQALAQKLERD